MSNDRFRIGRADGRSNAEVLRDHVRDKVPGTVLTFEELIAVLSDGSPRAWDRDAVRGLVSRSMRCLATSLSRVLQSVQRVGYRVAHANDHRSIALMRKRRGDAQIVKGLVTLQHVRWDEMDAESRKAHEGQLMVIEGVVQMQRGFDQRLKQVEDAIRNRPGAKKPTGDPPG